MYSKKLITDNSKFEMKSDKKRQTEQSSIIESLILTPIPLESLLNEIKVIVSVALKEDKTSQEEDKLISPAEACKIFEPPISLPTLSTWTKKGWLTSRKIGGRVFYSKKQVLEAGKILKRYKQL